ncbi:flagellar biosynthesis protein FlhF [Virgibacillus halodenitrificans]|uniref:Flagellar biosynthesis protein FlhF n=1 Tax=Virgibacillus halodenitrificans TaxID=1482 RepID=A0ABR7VRA9_VIRHA|nr:flagellar biosynthesis protein FlhF [Virgibacillus halodenitrificans]MBD1224183.1 flagellar biosynthesis protein FlhF [Virgibacillus halodenitrificans]
MKVKKYIGPTMPEVMKKIRKELGSEAVILNSKEVRHGGFLGLFQKTKIEVVAALDPDPILSNQKPAMDKEIPLPSKEIPEEALASNQRVLDEIKQLKSLIKHSAEEKYDYPADFLLVYQHLCDQEVDSYLADKIIRSVMDKFNDLTLVDYKMIVKETKNEVKEKLNELNFSGLSYENKVVYFVGPTGVGKTTTLAKIAANSMLKDHKKVAFITMDTYRIAAVEQLRTYARILEVPMEVAYSQKEYLIALEKFKDYDLVLVDTAGRNYRDKKYVNEIEEYTSIGMQSEMYLVLAMTAKSKDLTEVYDKFNSLPIKNVIFTKMDETTQFGSMLTISLEKQVGVGYITNGQDVPEDLLVATPELVTDFVFGSITNE